MRLRALFFISLLLVYSIAAAANAADKIGTSLRAVLQENSSWHKKRQKVECFVRLGGQLSDDMKKELNRAGLQIRSVIPSGDSGTIVTGAVPLNKLMDVAALQYVQSIEGAVPVGRKTPVGLK